MKTRFLHDHWTVRAEREGPDYPRPQVIYPGKMEATVPGHVHLDLVANQIIAHPFLDRHEVGCQWVDEQDWVYECEFSWHPDVDLPHRKLVFHGLDTLAEIYLNDALIASSSSMYLPCCVDVSKLLVSGKNELKVIFDSAVRAGIKQRREFFEREGLSWDTELFDERGFVRRPGYSFGWDWGPRLVSCGIWKPVELIEYQGRIADFQVRQEPLGNGRFRIITETTLEGGGEVHLTWNGVPVEPIFEVVDSLWWPNGEGDQVLHQLVAKHSSGQIIERKIGLRAVELCREPDEFGTSFKFVINGSRIWAKGANWIPHHSFLSQANGAEIEESLTAYRNLGMNMLRVWGGGTYESEEFYDLCDRLGILVWQDFPYACSFYPDDEEACELARIEAEEQIRRLQHRASLAIWCGNNECRSMWYGRWAGEKSPPRFYGERIYDDILRESVMKLDPGRPYVESSPLLTPQMRENATLHSDDHYWDVWHGRGDWVHYRESDTRFSSEFGFPSSCSMSTWKKWVSQVDSPDGLAVRWHDKTRKPWEIFHGMVEIHYPKAESLEEWVYTSQMNQRDAMRAAIEHYRLNPACTGALIWQANDCWPAQSWALEDFARVMKPAGIELKRLFADELIAWDGSEFRLIGEGELQTEYRDKQGDLCDREGAVFTRAFVAGKPWLDRFSIVGEPKDVDMEPAVIEARFSEGVVKFSSHGYVHDLVLEPIDTELGYVHQPIGIKGSPAICGKDISAEFLSRCQTWSARSIAGLHQIVF